MTNIIRTITLVPGENFTIPPNGTIVSITGDLISTCGELPTPETLSCYGAIYFIADNDAGEIGPMEQIFITGFKIGGVDYLFDTEIEHNLGVVDGSVDFQAAIDSNPTLQSSIKNACLSRYDGGGENGGSYILSFKSVPSLMTNASIIARSNTWGSMAYSGAFDMNLPIKLRSEITGLPGGACPCT